MRKLSAVIRTIGTRLITKKFPIWNKNIIEKLEMMMNMFIMTAMVVNDMMITRMTMAMLIIVNMIKMI